MQLRNLRASALGTGKKRLASAISVAMIAGTFALVSAPAASAETAAPITFEPTTYVPGDINGQDGWSKTGTYDVNVVDSTGYSFPGFGTQSLQVSNAVTSGSFGDHTFSKPLAQEAGETDALNAGVSGGVRQAHFDASFDIGSTESAHQVGMSMSVSPDRGDGARMSYLRFEDHSDGIHVFFDDYVDAIPYGDIGNTVAGCGTEDGFTDVDIATLERDQSHSVRISMDFVDGPRNDLVKVYIDGVLETTGTSWEDYFRWCENTGTSRTVDSLLFRTGGTAIPANVGNGFLFDNVDLESGPTPPTLGGCPVSISGANPIIYTLLADCTTDHTIVVPQNVGGSVFDGDGFSITGVDPVGGHFKGAVIKAQPGSDHMTVRNTTVQASNLQTACDAGDDRLRGIMFDGALGTITNNVVTNIEQGVNGDGCQEGNAIEVRNSPFDTTGSDLAVLITNNVITQYQKSGIVANGSVAATIRNNSVTGDGPISYIAQNGIQVGFGATAVVKQNSSSGNTYTPKSDLACGFLIYQAGGVSASGNNLFNNERNQCNFGKGGGTFKPSTP